MNGKVAYRALLIALLMFIVGTGGTKAEEGDNKYKMIKELGGGESVKIGGEDYILLNPNTGYVFKKIGVGRREYSENNLQKYSLEEGNIGYFLNEVWFEGLNAWEKELVQDHDWGISGLTDMEIRGKTWRPEGVPELTIKEMREKEQGEIITAKVGLLSGSEYRIYGSYYNNGLGYIPFPHKEWFWTITPVEKGIAGDNVWTVRKAGELHLSAKPNNKEDVEVHPTMYIKPTAKISREGELVKDQTGKKEGKTEVSIKVSAGEIWLEIPDIEEFGKYEIPGEAVEIYTKFRGSVKVKDYRGSNKGWRLNIKATPFSIVEPVGGFKGEEGYSMPKGLISVGDVQGVVKLGKEVDSIHIKGRELIDSGGVDVVKVEGGGTGEYEVNFGEDALGLILDPIAVKIDNENYPTESTPYESTITWELVSAP